MGLEGMGTVMEEVPLSMTYGEFALDLAYRVSGCVHMDATTTHLRECPRCSKIVALYLLIHAQAHVRCEEIL
jgi:hypothetical protein